MPQQLLVLCILGFPPASQTAEITVHVPPGTLVFLNGQQMQSVSNPRIYQTPKLEPGKRYYYEITAELPGKQGVRRETRNLVFKAGDTLEAVFDAEPFPNTEQIAKDLHSFYQRRYQETYQKMKTEMLTRLQENPLRIYQEIAMAGNGSEKSEESSHRLLDTVLNHRREQEQAILEMYRAELESLKSQKAPRINTSFISSCKHEKTGNGQIRVTLEHLVTTTDRRFMNGRISDFRIEKIHCLYEKQGESWVLVRFW